MSLTPGRDRQLVQNVWAFMTNWMSRADLIRREPALSKDDEVVRLFKACGLTPLESAVIHKGYGLGNGAYMSLPQLAPNCAPPTIEQVRRLELQALAKIKQAIHASQP